MHYLILAEKVTLIDTVKARSRIEMLARIAELIDPKEIDYIISDHSEIGFIRAALASNKRGSVLGRSSPR
jgi:flavorubredoxin